MTEQISGWTCEVLGDGTRQALGPSDEVGRVPVAWLRPDGSMEALTAVIPPAVVLWLTAPRKRDLWAQVVIDTWAVRNDPVEIRQRARGPDRIVHVEGKILRAGASFRAARLMVAKALAREVIGE